MPLLEVFETAAKAARLMVGVPDYDGYVAHRRAAHPGEPVMSRADFHRNRIEKRFGGGSEGISRCC